MTRLPGKEPAVRVPFMDLAAQYEAIRPEIDAAMAEVIRDHAFIQGPHAQAFERAFAAFCGAAHCVGVGNGTDALFLALRALGVGPGDEVVVPAMTFVATAEAVTMAGATPVFADVDPVTRTLDPEALRAAVTPRTRAVIPVHLYGHPADMDAIVAIAGEHGLKVVQDAAQAHGADIGGKRPAGWVRCLCFSFYPGKNLGAYGDAGAVVTDDEALARRVAKLANHGRSSKYAHEFEGVNSRMDGLQGAVLGAKLPHLAEWTRLRRAWARVYDEALADAPGLRTPQPASGHVYHLYVVQAEDRDGLRRHLSERGVATGIHYPTAPPLLEAYARLGHRREDFPNAAGLQDTALSLPMFPELGEDRALRVALAVREWCGA